MTHVPHSQLNSLQHELMKTQDRINELDQEIRAFEAEILDRENEITRLMDDVEQLHIQILELEEAE